MQCLIGFKPLNTCYGSCFIPEKYSLYMYAGEPTCPNLKIPLSAILIINRKVNILTLPLV